jgi:hypothetical protein
VTSTEKADGAWSKRGGEFSPSSTTEALRRRTVSLLDVGLRHCGLVHRERRTRRDSIKREGFFITVSSAIHVGELPYRREGIKNRYKGSTSL